MPIVDSAELPIERIQIKGPGVDLLERRLEVGSQVEVTEAELRRRLKRNQPATLRGLKMLMKAPLTFR